MQWQGVVATAAEALVDENNAFNPVYECLFGAGISVLSLVMLRDVFHRVAACIGFASLPVVIIALALFPVIGLGYIVWWIDPTVWCVAVGSRLIGLGRAPARTAEAPED